MHVLGQGVHGKPLYFPFNFVGDLKLLLKNIALKKDVHLQPNLLLPYFLHTVNNGLHKPKYFGQHWEKCTGCLKIRLIFLVIEFNIKGFMIPTGNA